MAEVAEQIAHAEAAGDPEPKTGRGRGLALVALLAVLGGGAGAACYLAFVPMGPAVAGGGRPVPEAARGGARHAFDPFIVSLEDGGVRRYLKASLQVEFLASQPPHDFDVRTPQLRDLLLTLFAGRTYSEVRTPEGRAALGDDIVARINRTLGADVVRAVHFTEFVVQ